MAGQSVLYAGDDFLSPAIMHRPRNIQRSSRGRSGSGKLCPARLSKKPVHSGLLSSISRSSTTVWRRERLWRFGAETYCLQIKPNLERAPYLRGIAIKHAWGLSINFHTDVAVRRIGAGRLFVHWYGGYGVAGMYLLGRIIAEGGW